MIMNDYDVIKFQQKIGYSFNDKSLLTLAFTHSSFSNENKRKGMESNERLEFLGDAVLELVISKYLFEKFSEMPEGGLTKLRAGTVCETTLAKVARTIGIGDYVLLGKGEESTGGRNRDSILSDVFEAIIGAICIDGGMEKVQEYILGIMSEEVEFLKNSFRTMDYKTNLQEYIQKRSKVPIIYMVIGEEGPDHDKVFIVNVCHNNVVLGVGEGRSKKEAEQSAAFNAIKKIKIK